VQSSGARSNPDVAYDADINTGFYVYNTAGLPSGDSGWWAVGGTSAGAPQWAALVAIADQGRALDGLGSLTNAQSLIYNLPASDFHDVTTGSNGSPAGVGYDLVTGRGSPYTDRVVAALINPGSNATASKSSTTTGSTRTADQVQPHAESLPIEQTGNAAAAASWTATGPQGGDSPPPPVEQHHGPALTGTKQGFWPDLTQLEQEGVSLDAPPSQPLFTGQDAPPPPSLPPFANRFAPDTVAQAGIVGIGTHFAHSPPADGSLPTADLGGLDSGDRFGERR
jgi:hypothetical protein